MWTLGFARSGLRIGKAARYNLAAVLDLPAARPGSDNATIFLSLEPGRARLMNVIDALDVANGQPTGTIDVYQSEAEHFSVELEAIAAFLRAALIANKNSN